VLIATIRPRDIVGKVEGVDKKIKTAEKDLKELVVARGRTLTDLHGIGPSGAARLLADVGDVRRFADRDRFASWNGTALLDASSGDQKRHRPLPRRQPDAAHHGRPLQRRRCDAPRLPTCRVSDHRVAADGRRRGR